MHTRFDGRVDPVVSSVYLFTTIFKLDSMGEHVFSLHLNTWGRGQRDTAGSLRRCMQPRPKWRQSISRWGRLFDLSRWRCKLDSHRNNTSPAHQWHTGTDSNVTTTVSRWTWLARCTDSSEYTEHLPQNVLRWCRVHSVEWMQIIHQKVTWLSEKQVSVDRDGRQMNDRLMINNCICICMKMRDEMRSSWVECLLKFTFLSRWLVFFNYSHACGSDEGECEV